MAQPKKAQRATIRLAVLAEPSLSDAVTARTDQVLADWCNAPTTASAWPSSTESAALFESMNVSLFDGLTAGKRAAWDLMLRNAPLDMGRAAMRAAVVDIWGATEAPNVLARLLRKATNAQLAVGGTTKTTLGVSALDLSWHDTLSVDDMSRIMNED